MGNFLPTRFLGTHIKIFTKQTHALALPHIHGYFSTHLRNSNNLFGLLSNCYKHCVIGTDIALTICRLNIGSGKAPVVNSDRNVVDKDIATVKKEIADYLATHPNAVDSLEGIIQWWLLRQRFVESADLIQEALNQMAAEGSVDTITNEDGQRVYKAKTKHH